MKNFVQTLLTFCALGALLLTNSGNATAQTNVNSGTIYVTDNQVIPIDQQNGNDLDFSRLNIGQSARIEFKDSKGTPYFVHVKKLQTLKLELAVNSSNMGKLDPDTTIQFKGKGRLIKTVKLAEIANQRCGLLCIITHICCVHIHLGPPGNTWQWSCSNCDFDK